MKESLFLLIFIFSFSFGFAAEFGQNYNNPLTCSSHTCLETTFCLVDGTNCALGGDNLTSINDTIPHVLNGTNHTGPLSSVRVIKDTGTNFLTQLLDIIIDALWDRDVQINNSIPMSTLNLTNDNDFYNGIQVNESDNDNT